jgi:hypothetical protein
MTEAERKTVLQWLSEGRLEVKHFGTWEPYSYQVHGAISREDYLHDYRRVPDADEVDSKVETPSILEEALKLSGENRQRDYGHPLTNHERIADVWNVVLGPLLKDGARISPEQVVWCMIGVKLAREVNTPKRDNAVDVVGYANCLDLIRQKREELAAKEEAQRAY